MKMWIFVFIWGLVLLCTCMIFLFRNPGQWSPHIPTSQIMIILAGAEGRFAAKFGRFATLQELARNNYLDPRFLTDPPQSIDGYYFSASVGSGAFTIRAQGYSEHFATKPYYINQNMVLCSDPACTQVSEDNTIWFILSSVGYRLSGAALCGIPGGTSLHPIQ